MGKGEEDIRGGQKKEGKKVQKRGKRREEKKKSDRKNWDLAGIEPMPGLKV